MAMALFSMPMQVRDARTGDVADKIRGSPLRRQRDESKTKQTKPRENAWQIRQKKNKTRKKNPP